jgi:formylglycine-generating enzyme required for sulfatase activity
VCRNCWNTHVNFADCKCRRIGVLAAILAVMSGPAGSGVAQSANPAPPTVVTIKGNVLCNRATEPKDWFWDTKDGDHTPVIYAIDGTPAIVEAIRTIMESYPERGLSVEDAQRIQEQFDKQLKYFLAPGALTQKIHKDVEAGSQLLALTGTLSEKDGKKWVTINRYEPAIVKYPAKMLAPDQPLASAGEKPILLKIDDKLSLQCNVLPAGRFLQGSPFYQRRYQDEFPHEVVLTRSFAMSEIPITQEIFEAVMGKNPSQSKGPKLPVDGVPFADIIEFCRILSQKNAVMVRLPTDAEWEYAARVGTSSPCFSEKYKDQISDTGSRPNKTPVKSKKPNAWGLYDMLSAGWHVTGDYKSDNVRVKEVDPHGPAPTDKRVHGDATGRLHKTRGGPHYDHIRPNIHGAATTKGTLWEGGSEIFRVVVER